MVSESIHKINFRINESNNNSNKSLCCFSAIGRQRCGTDSKSYRSLCRRGKGTSFFQFPFEAFFTLFREQIDAQRNAYEQRRVVNTQNAQRKVSKKRVVPKKTESVVEEKKEEVVSNAPIPLQRLVDVYPKIGTYTGEFQNAWDSMAESDKQRAIDFVPVYLSQFPEPSAQFYLNQYLKAKPWDKVTG